MRVGRRIDTPPRTTARVRNIARTNTLPARRASRLQYEYNSRARRVGRFEGAPIYAGVPVLRRVKD